MYQTNVYFLSYYIIIIFIYYQQRRECYIGKRGNNQTFLGIYHYFTTMIEIKISKN